MWVVFVLIADHYCGSFYFSCIPVNAPNIRPLRLSKLSVTLENKHYNKASHILKQ